jgi:hypothetical protein
MSSDIPLLGLRGWLIDTPSYGALRSWTDGGIIIEAGRIAEVGDYDALRKKPRDQPVRWMHSNRLRDFPGL